MAIYFLDSSAIAKHYVREQGSDWIASILDPTSRHAIHWARISGVEVVAAITKRLRIGSIPPSVATAALARFRADFGSFPRVTEISAQIISRAMDLSEKHTLRGYDAVQLAAAMTVHEGAIAVGSAATLVSAGDELNVAAVAEGLQVENPNLHK
jgi:uncharacterized protein